MIDKLLALIERPDTLEPATWTMDLARRLGARLFAVWVIDSAALPAGPEREDRLSETEEQAWKTLYGIEDDAFEQDVKVSLLLEQGDPLQRLLELCRSYEIELVAVGSRTGLPAAELVRRCPVPVVFVNESRRTDD